MTQPPPVPPAGTSAPPRRTASDTTGQVLLDGALILPRSVTATHALLTGKGVSAYRRTFPSATGSGTSSPTRVATHLVAGLVLGVLTVLVVVALVLSLVRSPLLLAPAGGLTLVSLAALGALHDSMTRRLIDTP